MRTCLRPQRLCHPIRSSLRPSRLAPALDSQVRHPRAHSAPKRALCAPMAPPHALVTKARTQALLSAPARP